MIGFKWQMRLPAEALLLPLMTARTFRNSVLMLLAEGLMSSFPLYLRMCCPRKSHPSAICVMTVFSCESSRPRSLKNASTRGLTSCSNTNGVRYCIFFVVPYSKWSRDLAIGGEKSAADYIDSHRPSGTRAHVQDDYRPPPS